MKKGNSIILSEDEINESRCNPESLVKILQWLRFEWRENLVVIPIDSANHALGAEIVSIGTVNNTQCNPADLFKCFLSKKKYLRAVCFAMAHNHPSGSTAPSKEDIALTRVIAHCGKMLNLQLLDHLIIGLNGFYSFKRNMEEILEEN